MWLSLWASIGLLLAVGPCPSSAFFPSIVHHAPNTRGGTLPPSNSLPIVAFPVKVGSRAPAATLLAEGLGMRQQSSFQSSRGPIKVYHINGSAIKDDDYAQLRLLVEQKDAEGVRALCVSLLRSAELEDAPLSVHSYLTLMKNLGRVEDADGAVLVFRALQRKHPGIGGKQYMKLIRILARLGKYQDAMGYLEEMGQTGSVPFVLEWNKLLDVLSRQRQWNFCKDTRARMVALQVKPNKYTFAILAHAAAMWAPSAEVGRVLESAIGLGFADNLIFTEAIKGLKKRKNWKAAIQLVHYMRSRGIVPDTVTYTAALSACERKANATTALALLALMKEDGVEANQWTYSASISALGHAGQLDEAVKLWEEMKERGLKRTQVVYNSLLAACEKARDLPRALSLLQEMIESDVPRDVITWNTIISACKGVGDWERASALLQEMQESDGIKPDTISYNAAIAACARSGQSGVEEARSLLARMQHAGVRRDSCTYNTLMDAYTRAGNFPAVLQCLEMMTSDDVQPDVISFTQALSAAERTRDWEAADALLAAMKNRDIRWNLYTYAVVMSICEKSGRWPQALKLLQSMRRAGLTPDATCYTVVMNACGTGKKIGHCLALLTAMRADGVEPTIHTFTVLLTAAISCDKWRAAITLYQDMERSGIRPNGVFVSSVIHALLEKGNTSMAQAVLRRIERKHERLSLDLGEYHVLLRSICRKGHLEMAEEVMEHMERVGVSPDVTSYNFIMLGHASQGDALSARRLADRMASRRVEPNVFTFINLVRACAVAGCPEKALSLLDPSFTWDFYSAAITIFHSYGCFSEADQLYAAAVQNNKAPTAHHMVEEGGDVLDLHGLSVPVASAAVRYTLKQTRKAWQAKGPSAIRSLILISGMGKGSPIPYSPSVRPQVQDMLLEHFYPPLDSTTKPGNAGRIVVSKRSILAWLEAGLQVK